MQIEIDIEKLISRAIIDGILNQNNIQREVDRVLRTDEYKKVFTENVKIRLNEIILSEDGKKLIDKGIIDGIVHSEQIQNEIEAILERDEFQNILQQQIKTCLQEVIFSEESINQILSKTKEYLENYDIENDDNLSIEINKGISDIMLMIIGDSFKRFKASNRQ